MLRKRISFFIFALFLSMTSFACSKKVVGLDVDKVRVVETDESFAMDLSGVEVWEETTLLTLMEELQKEGKITFSVSSGMITAINGMENTSTDFWMLYTSDGSFSAAWGSISYEGRTLHSASVGAETLFLQEGELYVWAYQTFSW